MGNPKQKWTSEEEEALRAGVAKHGAGKWKNIQRDPEFNHLLFTRSNIDLKDKWRNLSVANGQILRDKSKTPKAMANPAETPVTPLPTAQTAASVTPLSTAQAPGSITPLPIAHAAASVTPLSRDASTDVVTVVSSRSDGNNASKYTTMIYEALSALKEPNGSGSGAIANYIQQRHEVPQNFRKGLSSRLRRLVQQEKLEKIQNCYKKKVTPTTDTKIPATKQEDHTRSKPFQSNGCIWETVEEAAISAADSIAEAEKTSSVAARSVFEAERVSMMAEEMEALLQFAFDCFNQTANGEILLMA